MNRICAKLCKKLFLPILNWFDPVFIEFGCHGHQVNTDKWPIKADDHTWACNISILARFSPNKNTIYGRPNVNKPYLEKYGDERVKLGQQWRPKHPAKLAAKKLKI